MDQGTFQPKLAPMYFTKKFMKDHIHIGHITEAKFANIAFQKRNKKSNEEADAKPSNTLINTLICVDRGELVKLAGEVYGLQQEFKNGNLKLRTTKLKVIQWTRGGKKSRDKKMPTKQKCSFEYGVMRVKDVFAMSHYERPV